jgi:hypothetical protein
MRMMLKFSMDTEAGSAGIKSGSVGALLERLMGDLKPEAAYFVADGGRRTGYVFFDLAEVSDIPRACEPLFMELGADVTLTPAMTPADVAAGLGKLG